ncbi:hypothetical protein O3P69_003458 [Scylla paramamosain]|uniref:Uncharacterized protein n=1 Tax=Scylla paramamosain TaxID=85552 RepID=A0AAW0UI28_SCYPA
MYYSPSLLRLILPGVSARFKQRQSGAGSNLQSLARRREEGRELEESENKFECNLQHTKTVGAQRGHSGIAICGTLSAAGAVLQPTGLGDSEICFLLGEKLQVWDNQIDQYGLQGYQDNNTSVEIDLEDIG